MARPLRIELEDGWFHVMGRGIERRVIFRDEADRRHWLELLGEVHGRFRFLLHAYVQMDNHYHLILQTPDANLSQGMQWFQLSYSSWFNARHRRVGPLFQGRFKSIPIENDPWAYELSFYVHLNPLRIAALGLNKRGKKVEALGWKQPSKEQVAERLKRLREYRWSSYGVYAGYRRGSPWLESATLLHQGRPGKGEDGHRRYRAEARRRLTDGVETPLAENLLEGLVLGGEGFLSRIKRLAGGGSRETSGRSRLRRRVEWEAIIEAVEQETGETWETMWNRRGDWGAPMAMWLARRYGGLRLREIGERMGGMDYAAVSVRLQRFEKLMTTDRPLQRHRTRLVELLNVET